MGAEFFVALQANLSNVLDLPGAEFYDPQTGDCSRPYGDDTALADAIWQGSHAAPVRTVTASETLSAPVFVDIDDPGNSRGDVGAMILVDASGGPVTLTMPPRADWPDTAYVDVRRAGTGGHALTIAGHDPGDGVEQIAGQDSVTLTGPGQWVRLVAVPGAGAGAWQMLRGDVPLAGLSDVQGPFSDGNAVLWDATAQKFVPGAFDGRDEISRTIAITALLQSVIARGLATGQSANSVSWSAALDEGGSLVWSGDVTRITGCDGVTRLTGLTSAGGDVGSAATHIDSGDWDIGSFPVSGAYDGNTSSGMNRLGTAAEIEGISWLGQAFASPTEIGRVRFWNEIGGSAGNQIISAVVEYSDDGAVWYCAVLATDFVAATWNEITIGYLGGHRYWRLRATEIASVNWNIGEIEWLVGNSVATLDATSVAAAADDIPIAATLVVPVLEATAITADVDLTARISRDGGINWTDAPLIELAAFGGRQKVFVAEDVDLTAQPEGMSVCVHLLAAAGKAPLVDGASIVWRC